MKLKLKTLTFILAACILLSLPSNSMAELKKWKEVNHLSIVINGEMENSARFYLNEDRTFFIILSSAFNDALVLNIKDGVITTLNRAEITFEDNEFTAITSEDMRLQYLSNYTQTGSALKINLVGMDVSIIPRPHLIGKATMDEILNHTSAYKRLMNKHEPNPDAIKFLSEYNKPVNITVAFGTWCSHCKQWVPRLMKSISECNNSNLNCTYFGISQKFDQPAEFLKKNKIKKIPTIIIHRGGQEIGRIIGTPKVSMEDDLVAILEGTYTSKTN